jgi:hypothetical protein
MILADDWIYVWIGMVLFIPLLCFFINVVHFLICRSRTGAGLFFFTRDGRLRPLYAGWAVVFPVSCCLSMLFSGLDRPFHGIVSAFFVVICVDAIIQRHLIV